ncbi:hypothetical protein KKH27_02500 [bacterium]|nr:hypothetical protein [bacterium]MBU1984684.1 hypothetical protein [bacterium]
MRGGTDHLPLLHDRLLRYQERTGSTSRDYTLHLSYSGGRTIRVFEATFKGIDVGRCNLISNGPVVYLETNHPLTTSEFLPFYRQIWVDEEASSGASWVDEDMATETVFAGFETVSVPAGNFPDCYKTVTTTLPGFADSLRVRLGRGELRDRDYQREKANAGLVIIRWFARDVGLVKEQLGSSEHVRELVEVVRPGRGEKNILVSMPPDSQDVQE